jgi:glycerol-3-phosphate dehydrogenase (NAD(P)+)
LASEQGTIAIIGAGSWGTALSIALGSAGRRVAVWARRGELATAIGRGRRNPEYLSKYELPPTVRATGDLRDAVTGAAFVILAVPSHGMRAVCRQMVPHLSDRQAVVSGAKGLEHDSGKRMSEVILECFASRPRRAVAVLSGPNLAPEVAAGAATATVVASEDGEFAAEAQAALGTERLRVYTNADVLGVELGGVLKNVIAIGAGVSDGLRFGDNSKAALMTRGLAEMTRFGVAMGARPETFGGLSGIGDLVATCAGRQSRNHMVGFELAKGRSLDDVLSDMSPQVAEGVETTRAVVRRAASLGVEMPISEAVHAILFEGIPAADAVTSLMTRAGRDELED